MWVGGGVMWIYSHVSKCKALELKFMHCTNTLLWQDHILVMILLIILVYVSQTE